MSLTGSVTLTPKKHALPHLDNARGSAMESEREEEEEEDEVADSDDEDKLRSALVSLKGEVSGVIGAANRVMQKAREGVHDTTWRPTARAALDPCGTAGAADCDYSCRCPACSTSACCSRSGTAAREVSGTQAGSASHCRRARHQQIAKIASCR